MNIGDIAVVLTEKDSERLTLRAELNKLEDLQAAGTERLFRVTCTGIKKEGINTSKVVYSYSIDHTNFKHNAKAQGEVVEFELLTENDVIDIIAEVATTNTNGEATTLSYLAQFPTSRVPVTSHTDNTIEVTSTPATEGEEPAIPTPAPAIEVPEATASTASAGDDAVEVKSETAAPVETPAEETPADATAATPTAKPETETTTPAAKVPVETTLAVDDWVSISLQAVDGDDADSQAELHVTAKRIAIAEAIAEKNVELEKKVAEIEDLKQQLKTLQATTVKEQQKTSKSSAATSAATKKKTATTTAGKKKTTKTTKKTSKRDAEEDDEDEDEDDKQKKQSTVAKKSAFGIPSLAELQGYVVGGGMTLLNVALANRAFVFFGIAACGVYAYGDYASV